MIRLLAVAWVLLLAVSGRCEYAFAQQVPRINCETDYQRDLELAPLGSGPLHLKAVYCQRIRARSFLAGLPTISPDGQSIAYVEHNATLRIARLDAGDSWIDYRSRMSVAGFVLNPRFQPAISWASDSKSVWTADHETERPSGFAKSPLQPLKTAEGGAIVALPALRHDAGPLDELLWADGDGLAVAQFGTRGEYYRPAHADPNPSFAIVDAGRGLVLDTLSSTTIEPLREPTAKPFTRIVVKDAAAAKLGNGKVRVLLSIGQWVVWTEGKSPIALADPYSADFGNRVVMSPDGSRILVGRLLRTGGAVICEHKANCSRAGRPVEGILAAMHDLENRLIWSIRATVTADYEFPAPAISPDARFALIGLVPEGSRPLIGLVTLKDGQMVQTIPSPGGNYAMGFARGGLLLWTHSNGLTALYDVEPNQP
jgi:hypothetical protein